MRESIIIHQAFYNLFTLVGQHAPFQLINSLVNYNRVINQSFNANYCNLLLQIIANLTQIQAIIAFTGVTISLMHSATIATLFSE